MEAHSMADQPLMRTKTAAVLYAFFFLGDFGAHWFYLGEPKRGWFYPIGYVVGFILMGAGGMPNPLAGVFGTIGFLILLTVVLSRIYDFFYLLCMHPKDFDARYN
jgi:TM2 domain-containing membrane protein YozV